MKVLFDPNGYVLNISGNPAAQFHPSVAALFVDAPEGAPENMASGWRYDAGAWTEPVEPIAPVPPEPEVIPSQPILYAAASLKVVDFDITGIDVQSRFAGAFWADVGKYCVIFAEAQPDTAYMAMASAGPCSAYVLEEEKAEDMFTITVTNAAGEPTDAAAVNISIVRAS
jgi:hypothetical protein